MGEGSTHIGDLVVMLESNDAGQRSNAAEALCQMGDACREACVPLVRACAADEGTREWSVSALESMGYPPVESVPELTKLLSDPSSDVAYWAATLLGRLGSDAMAACDALATAFTSNRDLSARERAVWAAERIGCSSTTVVQALQTATASANPRLARAAQQALEAI